ncbi:MAG: hypothetical protein H0X03_07770 [Nitrosopumilus sp.]|nr:hypothetical protein [Nitrosopumilus sp.]
MWGNVNDVYGTLPQGNPSRQNKNEYSYKTAKPNHSMPQTQYEILKTSFMLFQENPNKKINQQARQQSIGFSELFFSNNNLDKIQNQIIKEVYDRSNREYLISRQSDRDVQTVMKSIFLQHSTGLSNDYTSQIQELNKLTVDAVVPGIISAVSSHFHYLENPFSSRQIMDHPQNTSIKGKKVLPSVTRTFI